jgi:hypothetical protein
MMSILFFLLRPAYKYVAPGGGPTGLLFNAAANSMYISAII